MNRNSRRYLLHEAPRSPLGFIRSAALTTGRWGIEPENMRILDCYVAVYVVEGRGRFLDGNGFRAGLKKGDLLLLFPGLAHSYRPAGEDDWTRFYVTYEGEVFDLWRRAGLLDPARPILHLEPVSYWLARLLRIIEYIEQPAAEPPSPERSLVEIGRLQEFLAEALFQKHRDRLAPGERQWLHRAIQGLEGSLGPSAPLEKIAGEMGVSYASFRKRFTALAGVSPGRYRARRRIEKAVDLLSHTRMSHQEIATALGFCDEFHFSRRFKSAMGLAPRDFRKELRKSGTETEF